MKVWHKKKENRNKENQRKKERYAKEKELTEKECDKKGNMIAYRKKNCTKIKVDKKFRVSN